MGFTTTKVVMRPDEHMYLMTIGGQRLVYRDRGEYGVFEPGIDVIEMGDHLKWPADWPAENHTCNMEPEDELLATFYGDEIMARARWVKGEIRNIIDGMHVEAEKRLHEERGPSWFGGRYNTYVDLNFGHWCGRRSLRDPYEERLYIDGVPRAKHGDLFTFNVVDHNADGKTDSIWFRKMYPDTEMLMVSVSSYGYGPEMEMWNGKMAPCIDVDLSRHGLEQYLGVMDDIYARAERDL